jgi:exo-beta-1,3-glucanase (GH17 family)
MIAKRGWFLLCLLWCVSGFAPADTEALRAALTHNRFIAYTPSDYAVQDGRVQAASEAAIERDLKLLRRDFQGLVTYGALDGLERIPPIAERLGFRALILGVWNPLSREELASAVRLAEAHPRLIVGVCVGNETLLAKRLPWPQLRGALANLRTRLPGVPVATSEPFYYYLDDTPAGFLDAQDFLLPSVHPVFQDWYGALTWEQMLKFVPEVITKLRAKSDKPLLVKETGLPANPAHLGFTPERQARFWAETWALLDPPGRAALGYFEAFDTPWKFQENAREFAANPGEAHWGFYAQDGREKPVLTELRRVWRE